MSLNKQSEPPPLSTYDPPPLSRKPESAPEESISIQSINK